MNSDALRIGVAHAVTELKRKGQNLKDVIPQPSCADPFTQIAASHELKKDVRLSVNCSNHSCCCNVRMTIQADPR